MGRELLGEFMHGIYVGIRADWGGGGENER